MDLWAKGPGLALQALQRGDNPAQLAAVQVIAGLDADVLLLTGIDYDLRGETLAALEARLATAGAPYPYRLPLRPNTGVQTGIDLDGNGILGEPRDAMAYGRWAGEGGMAVLSRLPIDTENIRDFSGFLWADLPGTLMPPDTPPGQPLSTTGAYEVPITLPDGKSLRLLAYYASPPIFDGAEDRNGRRNHDESAFWLHLLAGDLPFKPPEPPFVILGQSNLDPADGAGRKDAITALLHHTALQDPAPRAQSNRHDPGQSGDPAYDTALYPKIGGLRVEVILPSRDLHVQASGVVWPPDDDPTAAAVTAASRHRPLWVDLRR
ncbi:MAG: endonuclease [Pseudorhodobacter sp. PARRP1]|nr:MAG: endonuclease [Pseudorhodobacter sp. PARRP1]